MLRGVEAYFRRFASSSVYFVNWLHLFLISHSLTQLLVLHYTILLYTECLHINMIIYILDTATHICQWYEYILAFYDWLSAKCAMNASYSYIILCVQVWSLIDHHHYNISCIIISVMLKLKLTELHFVSSYVFRPVATVHAEFPVVSIRVTLYMAYFSLWCADFFF